jgi:hypothetical protein
MEQRRKFEQKERLACEHEGTTCRGTGGRLKSRKTESGVENKGAQ